VEHVLAAFAAEELPALEGVLAEAADAVRVLIGQGLAPAMNRYNRRREPGEAAGPEPSRRDP
jgi:peptidyl-tRNA hydrolase